MKKKVTGAFAGFLAVMLLFTFLSRAADSLSIAKVSVKKAERGKVNHTVTGTGKVVQNREQAVATLAGQTVKSIYVEEGQQVAKGDLLFEVDLVSLKEQILNKKQEMKKADLLSQDKASSRAAEAQRDAVSQSRAAEDYSVAAGKGNTAVGRAAQELNNAKKKLKLLEKSESTGEENDPVETVLKQACEDKQKEYEDAVKYKEELETAIDEMVRKAVAGLSVGNDVAGMTVAEHEIHFSGENMEGDSAAQLPAEAAIETPPETMSVAQLLTEAEQQPSAETEPQPPAAGTEAEPQPVTGTETETQPAAGTETEAQPEAGTQTAPQTPAEVPSQSSTEDGEWIIGGETEGSTEDPWLLEQRIRQENQSLLDAAEVQIHLKEQEKAEADAALASYQQEKAAGAQAGIGEMRAQLKEEIRAKQQAYEDAVTAANDSLRSAGRAVEDANAPKGTDSTGEIDAITREQEELQLEKLEKLLEAEGRVTAPIDATVTKINLTTGEKTPDGTAMLLSDTAAGNKLVVQVPESQEKYIARGDEAEIKANNRDGKTIGGLTIESVRASEADGELLDVTVQLPADSLEAGMPATLTATRISETYDCRIPIQALYEENGKYYVYVLSETSTVLGTELTASRLDVNVIDKNETDAALRPGALSGDQQVIVSSDKAISAGSRVRLAGG